VRSLPGPVATVLLTVVLLLFLSCAGGGIPFPDRSAAAERIARQGGLEKVIVETAAFPLTAFLRCRPGGDRDVLVVFIEGDGAAWVSRNWLSPDPTPRRPLTLTLAARDPSPRLAYLARPGQYADPGRRIDPAYWSGKRFAPEVVASLSQTVDVLKTKTGARRIRLVGYSGGAALAVLLAAGRPDVIHLTTIAGNLAPEALNRHHGVSPLEGSLNPLDAAEKLRNLPQRHYVGEKDDVVPLFVARAFIAKAGLREADVLTVVKGATHTGGWLEAISP